MKRLVLAFVSLVVLAGVAVLGSGSAEAAFVYACTPVAVPGLSGGGSLAHLTIYNPNTTTVNVTAKWLTKTGVNLSGVDIPCSGCGAATQYPGQTGGNTVPITAGNTQVTSYRFPDGAADLAGNVSATIRIVADQPVNVGWAFGSTSHMMCTESF